MGKSVAPSRTPTTKSAQAQHECVMAIQTWRNIKMRTREYLCAILIALCLCTLSLSCTTGEQKRLNCICLIDFSGSLSEETLKQYMNIISFKILQNLDEKDRLVVLPIDEGAKTDAVKLIYIDMAETRFSLPTDGYAHARDSTIKRIHDYVITRAPWIEQELRRQKELRSKFTYQTDLFSAIEQAAIMMERGSEDTFWQSLGRFITGSKNILPENVIFLFSDMIHETSGYTFAKRIGCDSAEATRIIQELRTHDALPNLSGCKVFINGRTGRNNQQVENIHKFWTRYFKEVGADLVAYDYDCSHDITAFLLNRRTQSK